ncbi:hypothetical protein EYF80_026817 [Liparis tanakae]|uniref:Uncharacterized protein n=1 Tax=Liparis tanakae TaxID=230148 RepID=A0A4Z2HAK8_9TELE|nr:hypothetical protein EYF80_026817 [Liparis tanakae]
MSMAFPLQFGAFESTSAEPEVRRCRVYSQISRAALTCTLRERMIQELKSKSNSNCNHASINRPATRAMQSKHKAVGGLVDERGHHQQGPVQFAQSSGSLLGSQLKVGGIQVAEESEDTCAGQLVVPVIAGTYELKSEKHVHTKGDLCWHNLKSQP